MSANTSITEGGKGRPFGPVKALMVQGSDGKYYPWFPESDRTLGTLSVDKNGVYKASDKGVYGWSRVSVNVPQNEGVTGRDPDTGEDVYVHPDPSGELVKDVLPVEIRVIEPPTNPYGTYVDGQTITKDGMVVKAYGANGDEMQIVPIGEITINPTVATYDPSKDTNGKGIAHGDIDITFIDSSSAYFSFRDDGTMAYEIYDFDAGYKFLAVNGEPCVFGPGSPLTHMYKDRNGVRKSRMNLWRITCAPFSLGYYYYSHSYDTAWADQLAAQEPPLSTSLSFAQIAGILKSAPIEMLPSGSQQTITVSWPRPGDGAILETTFDINVGPHGGTGDD